MIRLPLFLWGAALALPASIFGAPVDFERQIQPILEDKCYRCHDAEEAKGSLRLDSPAAIVAGGEGGEILVPGDPNDSSLYVLTTYDKDDPDYMPQKGKGLTKTEQKLLKTWIEEGAVFGGGFVHEAKPETRRKFDEEDPATARKYRIMGEAIEIVARWREAGLLVDTVNHDSSLFEVSYTYAERSAGSFDFQALEPLGESIRKLTLARTNVSGADLAGLASFTSIEFLDLGRTDIGDEAMDAIVQLKGLKVLNLRGTKVTDEGIQQLAKLKGLEKVYLWGSDVTVSGVKRLQKRLPSATISAGVRIVAPTRRNANPS